MEGKSKRERERARAGVGECEGRCVCARALSLTRMYGASVRAHTLAGAGAWHDLNRY